MAEKQKNLRNLIECCADSEMCKNLKKQRSEIKRTIKAKCLEHYNKDVEAKLNIIEALDYNGQMHAVIKDLNIKSKKTRQIACK